jgi:3-phosphoshikimate 1-carboxyvinyltransferase
MSHLIVHPERPLRGHIRVPGDKSISHRALLLGAIADGESRVRNFLPAADCLVTLRCLRALGVEIEELDSTTLIVHGRGLRGLRPPDGPLNCESSGTTMRLLAGILAGQPFPATLTGSPQLLHRPMGRVVIPLRQMGAHIADTDGHAPLHIQSGHLRGTDYTLPVASAQVKSAILLAGLYADGPTVVHEPGPARDHTERMLQAMGCELQIANHKLQITSCEHLKALDLLVPGDVSSAAFLMVAAVLMPGSEVVIEGVGVNPTRTGLQDVLRRMGAEVTLTSERMASGEPVADLTVRSGTLRGVEVSGETVVRMIDEFPVLAVAATQARGTTLVRDAAELRVKESDRIATVVVELRRLGARIEERPDGFIIHGPTPLEGMVAQSHGDHRLAMALVMAGLLADGETIVRETNCIADSFPGFVEAMRAIGGDVR